MKKIYKFLTIILSIICLASFAACGSGNGKASGNGGKEDVNLDDGWTQNY